MEQFRNYILIARMDRWYKNLFVLLGAMIAARFAPQPFHLLAWPLFLGLISVCFLASANYVINEWLDAKSDRYHPLKKDRSSLVEGMNARFILVEYGIFLVAGLTIAKFVSSYFFGTAILFGLTGVFYNVKPFRAKDKVYLDVLVDSFTSLLRLAMGWFAVTEHLHAPLGLLLGFWMGAAFFMNVKRLAELRLLEDSDNIGLYRRSFRAYTHKKLLLSSIGYGVCSVVFLSLFFMKWLKGLFTLVPFVIVLFSWYLRIGMRPNSVAQNPEELYREKAFLGYCLLLCIIISLLLLGN